MAHASGTKGCADVFKGLPRRAHSSLPGSECHSLDGLRRYHGNQHIFGSTRFSTFSVVGTPHSILSNSASTDPSLAKSRYFKLRVCWENVAISRPNFHHVLQNPHEYLYFPPMSHSQHPVWKNFDCVSVSPRFSKQENIHLRLLPLHVEVDDMRESDKQDRVR